MIRVTVTDPATGNTETAEVHDDYVIVCDGRARLASVQKHSNGTTVLTVKTDPAPGETNEGGQS